MSNGTSGNYEAIKSVMIELGHESAAFLPEDIVCEWYRNYLRRFKNADLDPNNKRDARILEVFIDHLILDGDTDELPD